MRTHSHGQTLVEFSLVLPVFLLTLFGLIDVGRLVYANSVLSQAARDGARVASAEAGWIGSSDASCGAPGGPVCPASSSALLANVTAAANRMVAGMGTITNVYLACTGPGAAPSGAWTGGDCDPLNAANTTGNLVSVRLVFTFTPITPVIGQIVHSVTLTGAATMVID